MSDISLDLDGFVAFFALLLLVGASFTAGVVGLSAAAYKAGKDSSPPSVQPAFRHFRAAAIFFVLNSLLFVFSVFFIEKFSRSTRAALDSFALFGWLPLNLILYFVVVKFLLKK